MNYIAVAHCHSPEEYKHLLKVRNIASKVDDNLAAAIIVYHSEKTGKVALRSIARTGEA